MEKPNRTRRARNLNGCQEHILIIMSAGESQTKKGRRERRCQELTRQERNDLVGWL